MAGSGKQTHIFIALSVLLSATILAAAATQFHVGDEAGWNLGVNYTQWAEGKQFRVGDSLVFRYSPEKHNVRIVATAADFDACRAPAEPQHLISRNDEISLDSSGTKWFICSKESHCQFGMKLSISVAAAETDDHQVLPAPPPAGWESAAGLIRAQPCSLVALLLAAVLTIFGGGLMD